HIANLNSDRYLNYLAKYSPGHEYRNLFDLARFIVGTQTAYDLFPAIAFASLCTVHPEKSAVSLFKAVAGIDNVREIDAKKVCEIANHELADDLLGTAIEVMANSEWMHPIYGLGVERLNELAEQGRFSVENLMTDPSMTFELVASELLRPTLCRARDDGS